MIWVLILILCTLGVWLLVSGRRARLADASPRCRKCDYQLQGITSDRCPECGQDLRTGTVIRGTRKVNRKLVVVGTILLLGGIFLGGFFVADRTNQINWYEYRPASWVIGDLSVPAKADQQRAWTEINRRIQLNSLSRDQLNSLADQSTAILTTLADDRAWAELMRQDQLGLLSIERRAKLVDFTLKEQASANPPPGWNARLDFLTDEFLAEKLSPAQRETFLGNMLKLNFTVRPQVVRGDEVPYRLTMNGRGPERRFWYRQHLGTLSLDGTIVSDNGGSSSGSGFSGSSIGSWLKLPTTAPAGRHELRLRSTLELHVGAMSGSYEKDKPLLTRESTLTAPFDLLDTAPPGLVELVDDAKLHDTIAKCISITDVTAPSYDGKGLSAMVHLNDLPMDCAFDVLTLIDGKEVKIATLTAIGQPNHSSGTSLTGGDFVLAPLPPTLTFILRSSDSAARRTTDLTRIWKGEIRIDDVPLKARGK